MTQPSLAAMVSVPWWTVAVGVLVAAGVVAMVATSGRGQHRR